MPLPYWALGDLEDRLSKEVVRQCLDDNNDGDADPGPVARLQADSDSFVEGYLRGIYNLDSVRLTPPNQVKRLSLDYAVAQCAKRHPEYVRRDFKPLEDAVKKELDEIRAGRVRLDVVGPPEPSANQGGSVGASGDITVAPVQFFTGIGGLGDF